MYRLECDLETSECSRMQLNFLRLPKISRPSDALLMQVMHWVEMALGATIFRGHQGPSSGQLELKGRRWKGMTSCPRQTI